MFHCSYVAWFPHKRAGTSEWPRLTSFIQRVEALPGWLRLLEWAWDAHCVALAEGVRATCRGGVVPTHNTACQVQGSGDARHWAVKRAARTMWCFFWKRISPPPESSAKSKAHASLNWSHLLALVGVSSDKCVSVLHFGVGFLFPLGSLHFISLCLHWSKWLYSLSCGRHMRKQGKHFLGQFIKFWVINCWCLLMLPNDPGAGGLLTCWEMSRGVGMVLFFFPWVTGDYKSVGLDGNETENAGYMQHPEMLASSYVLVRIPYSGTIFLNKNIHKCNCTGSDIWLSGFIVTVFNSSKFKINMISFCLAFLLFLV